MYWQNSILSAITYFIQAILSVFSNIDSSWVIGSLGGGTTANNLTLGSILLWYSCLIIGMIIIMRLIGGASTGGKKDV